jgi:hypothetical protein
MTNTTTKTVSIAIASANKCTNGSYIDFYIALDGKKPDADLYRIYSWESEFHKVLGFTTYGHAVRGKARKAATELILEMRKTACPIGIKEY